MVKGPKKENVIAITTGSYVSESVNFDEFKTEKRLVDTNMDHTQSSEDITGQTLLRIILTIK